MHVLHHYKSAWFEPNIYVYIFNIVHDIAKWLFIGSVIYLIRKNVKRKIFISLHFIWRTQASGSSIVVIDIVRSSNHDIQAPMIRWQIIQHSIITHIPLFHLRAPFSLSLALILYVMHSPLLNTNHRRLIIIIVAPRESFTFCITVHTVFIILIP